MTKNPKPKYSALTTPVVVRPPKRTPPDPGEAAFIRALVDEYGATLTVSKLTKVLGLKRDHVYGLHYRGAIPGLVQQERGEILYRTAAVARWLFAADTESAA